MILHGRCGLTGYAEAKPIEKESARVIGLWILEDIICRWGCPATIVTDNASTFLKAVAWLEAAAIRKLGGHGRPEALSIAHRRLWSVCFF